MSHHVVLTFPHSLGVPGGGAIHCRRLALELRRAGAEVTLMPVEATSMSLLPRPAPPPGEAVDAISEELERAGVEIRAVRQNRLTWWLDGLGVRRRLRAVLASRPPDAVLGWWGELAWSTGLLAERGIFCGLIAATPYSLWWKRPFGSLRRLQHRMDDLVVARTARRVDRVFANSAHTAAEVASLLGVEAGRIEVVYPPVGATFARPSRRLSGKIERLIFFGRLRPKKGILDLIEALGRLDPDSRQHPWQLRVAGSGDTAGVLRAAREQGIEDRVTLLGELEEERLAEELDWAQLAVLPSHEESFGLAVAEAQLAGLPVIAYDAGAIGEICAAGEAGWLVPTGDIEALAGAIGEALADPEETRRRAVVARDSAQRLLDEAPAERILRTVGRWKAGRTGPATAARETARR